MSDVHGAMRRVSEFRAAVAAQVRAGARVRHHDGVPFVGVTVPDDIRALLWREGALVLPAKVSLEWALAHDATATTCIEPPVQSE